MTNTSIVPGDEGAVVLHIKGTPKGAAMTTDCNGLETGEVTEPDLKKEKALIELVHDLIADKILKSCHDISDGGLIVYLAEFAIKGNRSCEVNIDTNGKRLDGILFSEAADRVVASLSRDNLKKLQARVQESGLQAVVLGDVIGDNILCCSNYEALIKMPVAEASVIWKETIECFMK